VRPGPPSALRGGDGGMQLAAFSHFLTCNTPGTVNTRRRRFHAIATTFGEGVDRHAMDASKRKMTRSTSLQTSHGGSLRKRPSCSRQSS